MSFDADKTQLPEDSSGSSSLTIGQAFGQYKVIRQLGRGGMGEVYEVEHPVIRKRYALKLVNSEIMSRPDAVQRFQREAQVMAQMEHPNIVHVDDFGETDGRTWLRMELISGGVADQSGASGMESGEFNSLADLLTGQPLPEKLVVDLLKQILSGLSYAHGQGVVHRDLKPSNILLQSPEKLSVNLAQFSGKKITPKITDFGLVRLAGEQWLQSQVQLTVARSRVDPEATRLDSQEGSSSKGTSTQALLGTFEFMAPEQKEGREADARADLFALGLIAFRMLTGHKSPGFEMPSEIVPGLHPGWDAWVKQALAQDVERRFESAEAMLEALPDGSVMQVPTTKAPTQPKARPVEPSPRTAPNRKPVWLFIILALLMAGGVSAYYFGVYAPDQARKSELARLEAAKSQSADAAERAWLEAERTEREKSLQATAAERARVANARGGIVIHTEPTGAKVTVGALVHGQVSPIALKDVILGEYPVTVTAAGYEDWQGLVQVEEDQFADMGVVKLVRKEGSVSITSLPSGASVYADGRNLGKTPLSFEKLPEGTKVAYELRLEGYQNASLSGEVPHNRVLPLRAVLKKIAGPESGRGWTLNVGSGERIQLKWIAPGSFQMGSNNGDSKPPRHVTLTMGYWLGVTEVTQGQWQSVMGINPSAFKGSSLPVETVSWEDAMSFCRKLTNRELAAGRLPAGYEYTLPTEAQWEYACRAGTTGRFSFGNDKFQLKYYANYKKTPASGDKTTIEIASLKPNSWSLYDMSGNVSEWCSDWYSYYPYPAKNEVDPIGSKSGTNRVTRGGHWHSFSYSCGSADRGYCEPNGKRFNLGFRLALTPKLLD